MTDSESLLSLFYNTFFASSTSIGSVLRSPPLLCQIAGSSAFNLNLPSSDKDYFGVFLFNANASLSSGTLVSVPFSIDGHLPEDHQLYELEFYLQLLLKGNPKVIEPIFTDKLCYRSPLFISLSSSIGPSLITQHTVRQYIGFAMAQIRGSKGGSDRRRLNRGEKKETEEGKNKSEIKCEKEKKEETPLLNNPKPYYHALRLLQEAKRMVSGEAPKVWLEGSDREFLMKIRTGEYKKRVEELQEEVRSLRSHISSQISVLPSAINPKILSDFLVNTRIKVLEEECPLTSLPSSFSSSSPVPIIASNVIMEKALKVLKEHDKEGKSQLVCCYASGSYLHENKVSSSNLDIVGIYAASSEELFSLEKPPTFLPFVPTTKETQAKGVLLLELSHALGLLANGNHRLMEIFFMSNSSSQQSKHIGYESAQWKQLKENQELRKQTLSKPAFHHYVGIAQGILGNLNNSKLVTSATSTSYTPTSVLETTKNLSLAKLFLGSARRISEEQEPMIELDEESRGIRREQLTEGDVSKYQEELAKLFQELQGELEEVLKIRKSKEGLKRIPDSPKALLNDWLVQTRKELHWWNKQR